MKIPLLFPCVPDTKSETLYAVDAMETVREISNLIRFSPKRLHLFSSKLNQEETTEAAVKLKPLCPTRWTARTGTIDAILKDYTIVPCF